LNTERETLHISDDKQRIAQIDNDSTTTTVRYQLSDHLGSSSVELDENADIISYEEYYPFGSTSYRNGINEVDVSLKRYKYVMKELDNETGLYYYGMRYYASWICRFVSVDPLQHKYPIYTPFQYAGNKPIRFIDIDGMEEGSTWLSGGFSGASESTNKGLPTTPFWGAYTPKEKTTFTPNPNAPIFIGGKEIKTTLSTSGNVSSYTLPASAYPEGYTEALENGSLGKSGTISEVDVMQEYKDYVQATQGNIGTYAINDPIMKSVAVGGLVSLCPISPTFSSLKITGTLFGSGVSEEILGQTFGNIAVNQYHLEKWEYDLFDIGVSGSENVLKYYLPMAIPYTSASADLLRAEKDINFKLSTSEITNKSTLLGTKPVYEFGIETELGIIGNSLGKYSTVGESFTRTVFSKSTINYVKYSSEDLLLIFKNEKNEKK